MPSRSTPASSPWATARTAARWWARRPNILRGGIGPLHLRGHQRHGHADPPVRRRRRLRPHAGGPRRLRVHLLRPDLRQPLLQQQRPDHIRGAELPTFQHRPDGLPLPGDDRPLLGRPGDLLGGLGGLLAGAGRGDDQRLVIQWNDVDFIGSRGVDHITFQAVLSEADGSIQFNYLDLATADDFRSEGASATVGIKKPAPRGRIGCCCRSTRGRTSSWGPARARGSSRSRRLPTSIPSHSRQARARPWR